MPQLPARTCTFARGTPWGRSTAARVPAPWARVTVVVAGVLALPAHAAVPGPSAPTAPWGLLFGLLILVLAAAAAATILANRRRERRLRETTARYEVFYELAPVAIMVSDIQHRVLDWNRAAEKLFGWTREEVIGRDFFEFLVRAEDMDDVREAVDSTLRTTTRTTTMSRNIRRDGELILCDWSNAVINGGNGEVTAVVSMAVDVTEQRRMERRLKDSERRFRSFAENAYDVIWTIDLLGNFTYVSPSVEDQSGFTPEEVLALNVRDVVAADRRELLEEMIAHVRDHGTLARRRLELEQPTRFGRSIWTDIVVDVIADEWGTPREILGITRDVTEQRRVREELRTRVAAIEAAADAVMITDPDGAVQYLNPAFARLTGYTQSDLLGVVPRPLRRDERGAELAEEVWARLRAGEVWSGELYNRHRNGTFYTSVASISPVRDESGRIIHLVGISRDISDRKALEAELTRLAHYDALTGLPNRTLFFDRLHERIRQARRSGEGLALLFLDLDGFKPVNDELGHESGDEALRAIAERFSRVVRESDTVARMAGDEFAVLLGPMPHPTDAHRVAEKLVAALAAPIPLSAGERTIGVSVGIALFPDHATEADALLKCADQAMYGAKRAGKNRYHFSGDDAAANRAGGGTRSSD